MAASVAETAPPRLPATLHLGPVHLTVSTLDGSVAFYERALGLHVHDRGEAPRAHAGAGLVVAHVHVHVGDLEAALAFYRDVLGFEVMADVGGALLVAAGGYHHHLAFNVWLGRDVTPPPPRTAGLREWTVLLASRDELAAVRARIAAAGLVAEAHRGGFLVRDPWEAAVGFRVG